MIHIPNLPTAKNTLKKTLRKKSTHFPFIWWLNFLTSLFVADWGNVYMIKFFQTPSLLYESNILTVKQADETNEYESFVNKITLKSQPKVKNYNIKNQRSDAFIQDYIFHNLNYSSWWMDCDKACNSIYYFKVTVKLKEGLA